MKSPYFEEMFRYQAIYPEIVLSRTFVPIIVTLAANTATRLIQVTRPKAYVIANINNPNNTPLFIGPNQSVNTNAGFPIVSGERIRFGLGENMEVWGFSVATLTVYILDMGL